MNTDNKCESAQLVDGQEISEAKEKFETGQKERRMEVFEGNGGSIKQE